MTESKLCQRTACGYTCIRFASHGMLHYDNVYKSWWILEPHDEDERVGRKPMSGYVLLHDDMLVD